MSPVRQKRKRKSKRYSEVMDDGWKEESTPCISEDSVHYTINLLTKKQTPSQNDKQVKRCKGELNYTTAFDSSTCFFMAMRRCMLTRNWKRLTDLLMLFMRKFKSDIKGFRIHLSTVCIL